MDNLDKLYSHLIEAQDYVERKMPSSAKMSLMAAERLLEESAEDYSDVLTVYCDIHILRINILDLMRFSENRQILIDKLEESIEECSRWLECRRAA